MHSFYRHRSGCLIPPRDRRKPLSFFKFGNENLFSGTYISIAATVSKGIPQTITYQTIVKYRLHHPWNVSMFRNNGINSLSSINSPRSIESRRRKISYSKHTETFPRKYPKSGNGCFTLLYRRCNATERILREKTVPLHPNKEIKIV